MSYQPLVAVPVPNPLEEAVTNLAKKLETAEKEIEKLKFPETVTTLPLTPKDGQIVYLKVPKAKSAADEVIWILKYNEASKLWLNAGSTPIITGFSGATELALSESEVALAGGPELEIPIEGTYEVGFSCRIESTEVATRTMEARLIAGGVYTGKALEVVGSTIFMGNKLGQLFIRTAVLKEKANIHINCWQTGTAKGAFTEGRLSLIPIALV